MYLTYDSERSAVLDDNSTSAWVEGALLIESVGIAGADVFNIADFKLIKKLLDHTFEEVEICIAAVHTDSQSLRLIRERIFILVLLLTAVSECITVYERFILLCREVLLGDLEETSLLVAVIVVERENIEH